MQRIENDENLPPIAIVKSTYFDLTPPYSSKSMRFRVTAKKLGSLQCAAGSALEELKMKNFFIEPPIDITESPEIQFNKDKHRGYYFSGKELSKAPLPANVPAWGSDIDQNMGRLTTLFGEEAARNIVAGHSQIPSYYFMRIAAHYLNLKDSLVVTPIHQIVNFSKKPDGNIYQEVTISGYLIKGNKNCNKRNSVGVNDMGVIGYLPGPARMVYKLEKIAVEIDGQLKDVIGYRLQYVESENKDILNMFCNRSLSSKQLRRRYCQHSRYVEARCNLETAIADYDNCYDDTLKKSCIDVLHASINAFNNKSMPEHIIAKVLNDTSNLLKSPNIANARSYQRQAQTISNRPWGKVLAASMLVFASTALIAASTAIALVSFGALAPVSILGFTLAASTLVGSIAVGAGTIGLATTVGGATLFAKDIKKPRVKLTDEMTSLAKQVKSRG